MPRLHDYFLGTVLSGWHAETYVKVVNFGWAARGMTGLTVVNTRSVPTPAPSDTAWYGRAVAGEGPSNSTVPHG